MTDSKEERFEWHKKKMVQQQSGIHPRELEASESLLREQNRLELERLKRRRLEREAEAERLKQENFNKDKVGEEWREKERMSLLENLYHKAFRRVGEGRGNDLDHLLLNTFGEELVISTGHVSGVEQVFYPVMFMDDPVETVMRGSLDSNQVHEILELETRPECLEYWTLVLKLVTCDHQNTLDTDILDLLKNKTYAQLCALEQRIKTTNMLPDADYREEVLAQLSYTATRVRLLELNTLFMKRRRAVYGEDFEQITAQKPKEQRNKHENQSKWDQHPSSIAMYTTESHRSVNPDEVPFNVEAEDVSKPLPPWSSLHTPRLPRYFNRARTSYEWNKYNQTHYDTENPPPKTLQGFRFNIFYPDLVDPNRLPTYDIEEDPNGDGTTKLIWFRAGAPYMDLVFRIPNTEWETAAKHGFRCTFDRRALRLHFWFKKARFIQTK